MFLALLLHGTLSVFITFTMYGRHKACLEIVCLYFKGLYKSIGNPVPMSGFIRLFTDSPS